MKENLTLRDAYTDEFGFTAPLPITDGQRKAAPVGFPSGPEVGEHLPDFELPTSAGTTLRLHEDRAGSKAAVMFFRSAVW